MPTFDKRSNGKRNPTIRKMRGKRSISDKSKIIISMNQHDKNDSQQTHGNNKW